MQSVLVHEIVLTKACNVTMMVRVSRFHITNLVFLLFYSCEFILDDVFCVFMETLHRKKWAVLVLPTLRCLECFRLNIMHIGCRYTTLRRCFWTGLSPSPHSRYRSTTSNMHYINPNGLINVTHRRHAHKNTNLIHGRILTKLTHSTYTHSARTHTHTHWNGDYTWLEIFWDKMCFEGWSYD